MTSEGEVDEGELDEGDLDVGELVLRDVAMLSGYPQRRPPNPGSFHSCAPRYRADVSSAASPTDAVLSP